MNVHPIPIPKKRNVPIQFASINQLSESQGLFNRNHKKLRRLPHVFSRFLELPFSSDADVLIEETPDCFRFVAVTDNIGGGVRAHAVEIHPGVTKIVVRETESTLDELELDVWRWRLPESTRPELASAVWFDGELIVTVPKAEDGGRGEWQRSRPAAPFVLKTYELVDDPSVNDVISWSDDGSAFIIRQPADFATDLLPTHFKHNNFTSFLRQLNTYGFRKVAPHRWEFEHDCFKKGAKGLLGEIHRREISSSASASASAASTAVPTPASIASPSSSHVLLGFGGATTRKRAYGNKLLVTIAIYVLNIFNWAQINCNYI